MGRVVALGIVLGIAACGRPAPVEQSRQAPVEQPSERTATSDAPAAQATAAPSAAAAPAALDFSLPGVTGGQVVGAELAGKDVVLWFWAPW